MDPLIISAGIAAASQGINAAATGKMNKKTREWNEKMYGIQREHALADWARQNEYNSPMAQMQRLRDAGLNPNLVYNNGATHSAQAVQKSDMKQWSPQAPQFDFGQIVDQYFGTQQRRNAIDISEQQIKALKLDNINKELKNIKDSTGLPFIEQNLQANLEKTLAATRAMQANTDLSLGRNTREAIKLETDTYLAGKKALEIEQSTLLKKAQTTNTQQQLDNLKASEKILIEQGNLAKLSRLWKEAGLNNNSSRVEWLIAQFAMDPENANKRLQNYMDATGRLVKSGARETASKFKELWNAIWGQDEN